MSDTNSNSRNTKYFDPLKNTDNMVREVIKTVYEALEEKGYNPVSQIIGYIMSAIFAGIGIYAIAMPAHTYTVRSIIIGSALVIAGILLIAVGARREARRRRRSAEK